MNRSRSWGAGTAAVARNLIDNSSTPTSGAAIARAVGVSQPRGSQILTALASVNAARLQHDGWMGEVDVLFDLYLARSRPHLASPETYWYGMKSLTQQVEHLQSVVSDHGIRFGVSADVGPDLLAPWRHPTLCVIYVDRAFDVFEASLVPAEGAADSTIILRVVDDTKLFVAHSGEQLIIDGIALVNPIQQWADLMRLGGADRLEAADRLKRAIIERGLPS